MSDGIGRKKRRIINAGLKTREQNEEKRGIISRTKDKTNNNAVSQTAQLTKEEL